MRILGVKDEKDVGDTPSFLESLGTALKQECEFFGFTELENPFLAFLRTVLTLKVGGQKVEGLKENMKSASYGKFHNCCAQNLVTKEDLRGNGSLGITNLIFQPGL